MRKNRPASTPGRGIFRRRKVGFALLPGLAILGGMLLGLPAAEDEEARAQTGPAQIELFSSPGPRGVALRAEDLRRQAAEMRELADFLRDEGKPDVADQLLEDAAQLLRRAEELEGRTPAPQTAAAAEAPPDALPAVAPKGENLSVKPNALSGRGRGTGCDVGEDLSAKPDAISRPRPGAGLRLKSGENLAAKPDAIPGLVAPGGQGEHLLRAAWHLRQAAAELESAGRSKEAGSLRAKASRLEGRAGAGSAWEALRCEVDELRRQVSELSRTLEAMRSEIQSLTGRPALPQRIE